MSNDVEGLKEFASLLDHISSRVEDPRQKEKILKPAGEYVAEKTKEALARDEYLHRRSGRLSDEGIVSEWEAGQPDEALVGWADLKQAPYGWFQERGFYHAKSGRFIHHPHLIPTFEKEQENVFRMMEDQITEEVFKDEN